MNEVEKMYSNAGIETLKDCKHYLRGDGNWCNDTCDIDKGQGTYSDICYLGDNHDKNDIDRLKCPYCEVENFGYPPFTAEKQLYIIKWLSDKADYIDIHYDQYKGLFNIQTGMGGLYVCNEFEQALASRVNIIWQDLTEEERKQIKNILESEVRE